MLLTLAALNRATLARQLLLARDVCTPLAAIERVGGLQAQLARPPFVGLWSRLHGFERSQLLALIERHDVVRATMWRGTLHLLSAADFARFRLTLQPLLGSAVSGLGERAQGLDIDAVAQAARELLADGPRTFDEIRVALAPRWPAVDERAIGYAVRTHLSLVQVPSANPWGYDTGGAFALGEQWTGRLLAAADPAALVRRYLAAFGPATPADATAWSGLRNMRVVFDAMRPELATFRDEASRELFDLPDAPRPNSDVDAPVRLLPEFDTLVLAHADRTRVIADVHRPRVVSRNLQVAATFLVDGTVAGTWRAERKRGVATLTATPFVAVATPARRALEAEALALLSFVEPDARDYAVQIAES